MCFEKSRQNNDQSLENLLFYEPVFDILLFSMFFKQKVTLLYVFELQAKECMQGRQYIFKFLTQI